MADNKEYIEREQISGVLPPTCPYGNEYSDGYNTCLETVKGLIREAPAINPDDLRPHGRWSETNWAEYDGHGEVITHYEITALKCSNCCCCFKKEALWRRNYCPSCGAKMDSATDNNVGGKIDSSDELPSWQQSMLHTFGGDADV